MKANLFQRVLWLLIPLLTLFNVSVWGTTYTGTFKKITSTDSLQTGNYVIVSSESAALTKAMGKTISTGRLTGQNVTIANDTIHNPDDGLVWLITKSTSNYTFYNRGQSQYLYQSSSTSSNKGKNLAFNNNSYNFTLSGYSSTSPVGFKFTTNGSNYNKLKWNNGSSWFSAYDNDYSTTMAPVRLYRQAYRVIYNGNGNTGGTVPSDNNLHFDGVAVGIKGQGTMVKEGYTFAGWVAKDASNNTVTITNSKITMPTSNVTVTAQWESAGTSVSLSKAATTNGSFS